MAHRVVIIGGGFGGLYAARALKRAPVTVTLVDRRNFHLFQPLLYQVATGGLSPANIAAPLRAILKRQSNVEVLMAEMTGLDPQRRSVTLDCGPLPYDTLILATGAENSYFGHKDWQRFAPALKTIEDATEIRRRILIAFERGEQSENPAQRRVWLTFVVIGGGPTGVELAGALAEIARHTLRNEFDHINPATARILLVEAAPALLSGYPPELCERARASLLRLGVDVRTDARVTSLAADRVTLQIGDQSEVIESNTILWAAGVRATPAGRMLAEKTGAALDRTGRVIVQPDLTVPGHPEIFVIGDLAALQQDGEPLPGTCPVAMQQGGYAAQLIADRLRGRPAKPFRYWDKGKMATIGRAAAVAVLGRCKFSGYLAWLLWLFVHIMFLVQFERRLLVFTQWAWNYLTWSRSSRLITYPRSDDDPDNNP